MSEAELLIRDASSYLRPEDVRQLQSAYRFSEAAHDGQYRRSGEPYISHPVAVATILVEWHLDSQALAAALLHDVMEDTTVTKGEISDKFGRMVAELVDGVSKLDKIEFESQEHAQAENFRKMFLAMARDVRVILIKLADRLHNMRTLDVMQPSKRARIARETMEIYAPIANRLGLNRVYQELQDLAFRNLYPNRYRVLKKALEAQRGNRKEVLEKMLEAIRRHLEEAGIDAQVTGREKNLYSIYRKMQDKNLSFSKVLDIYAFRVIVRDVAACYLALGALHGLYKPIPGKFKDYIAIPKANGYQSLHTTLFGPFGSPIELQVRTQEMHKIAEAGVASHWLYKSTDASLNELQRKTHQWLQNLLEMQSETGDSVEFLEHLKVDLFPDETYVFTPKGKIMALPHGATCVDFAYAVHTDIGNRCVAVKVNHELMPLRTELKNGDRVEIITASHAKPNPSWLNFVVTAKARHHIRHFLKTMQYEESAQLGERLLAQALGVLGGSLKELREADWERLLKESAAKSKQEVLADIGLGRVLAIVIARKLLPSASGQSTPAATAPGPVVIRGSEGMALQFAKCCHPIPGDPIIGFIRKGRGMIVHTHDCPVIAKMKREPEKWLDVEWAPDTRKLFSVNIKLLVSNQQGVLATVASEISANNSNIENVSVETGDSPAYSNIHFTLQVTNRMHLAQIMRGLRRLPEVIRINRLKG
ncbi:MAG TPA: bifunctional (p)ppGpp synthetase/guanosine-3',5'-bis(diphosphate) 3'-pyrophosphohydrolase [Burkholderiales bacterium]|nr:bifunctional (p)ppGpp synthetase/guanosine-3',5'-bis(diphosphate) 3'-pyrophosphohydrolase [Burkholderiales bacterium]